MRLYGDALGWDDVHVDYATQARTPKAGYHRYRDFIGDQR